MRKSCVLLICAVMIAGYGIGRVLAENTEDTLCIPMGTLLLEAPDGFVAKRSPVEFPHSTHFEFTCKTCHHTWDGETPVQSCSTAGCHDLSQLRSDDGKIDPALAVRNFKAAYHGSCIACHKEINLRNREIEKSYSLTIPMQNSGPTSCNACHPKE